MHADETKEKSPVKTTRRDECNAQNAATEHHIKIGTKWVRSEGKIKAQLPFRVSLCLHIAFQDLTEKLGVIS
ncbi:hypothetical protein, partial [Asticcacaulis benevestitus]|uniref:hypothetical protein n=1 Tax=Asticcacaulis benevestitus TaxID=347481 RepID=UPI001F201962